MSDDDGDDKIVGIKGEPFKIHVGDDTRPSSPDVINLLQKMLGYARDREFKAVGIIMVDKEHSAITGYHMEAGVGTTLVGGCSYLALRINKFMDREDGET
jgi:hypothetical protein